MHVPEELQTLLAHYPVVTPLIVRWGEMDLNDHVNNVAYLRWVEEGRMDYLGRIDFDDFSGRQPAPILAESHCKYIIPLTYPDTVYIGTRVRELGADRFVLETAIVSARHKRLAAVADALMVVYDYRERKKIDATASLVEAISRLEGGQPGGLRTAGGPRLRPLPLEQYPVRIQIPTQWAHLDAAGHVNNTHHLRWGESGRVAYLLALEPDGWPQEGQTIGPILAKLHTRYFAPVHFPDTVEVGTRCTDFAEGRFAMESVLVSAKSGRPAALVRGEIVYYDYQKLVKAPLPEGYVERVHAFEAACLAGA
ncbi:MAG: acyl-CoA thioesterase [Bacteroidetes bacterium]|nr:MAG: acyl-CoA thioesterase [Bacteroidota bacterium]